MKVRGYHDLVTILKSSFEIVVNDEHGNPLSNVLTFPYDWRQDNTLTAKKLDRFVASRLQSWRSATGAKDAKVILIAHSMGGLVSRYYLEVLGGWRNTAALFTFGTPFRGSIKAINVLANGCGSPFTRLDSIVRQFPSVYQMVPYYAMVRDGNVWSRINETALRTTIPTPSRLLDADLLRTIDNHTEQNLSSDEYLRSCYKFFNFIGVKQPTLQSAKYELGTLSALEDRPEIVDPRFDGGDGVVPRVSAIPLYSSPHEQKFFACENHTGIVYDKPSLINLVESIRHLHSESLNRIRGTKEIREEIELEGLSLRIDDLVFAPEPIRALVSIVPIKKAVQSVDCVLKSSDDPRTEIFGKLLRLPQNQWTCELSPPKHGFYVLTVNARSTSNSIIATISDLVAWLDKP
jgi:hypothetical protein